MDHYLSREGAPHVFRIPSSTMAGDSFLPDRRGTILMAAHLLYEAEVKNGRIFFPSGATYRLLVLPASHTMTPKLLNKVVSLIKAGAMVIDVPPKRSPSLTNYPENDQKIEEMVNEIWGSNEVPSVQEGKIIWEGGIDFAANDTILYPKYAITAKILEQMGVQENFKSTGEVRYTHRTAPDWDIFLFLTVQMQL